MSTDGDLHYLIYTSKAVKPFDGDVLDKILNVSRAWNEDHDITGVLLYHNGNVMQVLEGPRNEILDLFEQIQKDKRHRDLHRLAFRSVEKRTFANWTMAFKDVNDDLFNRVDHQRRNIPLTEQISYTDDKEDSVLSVINMFIAIHPLS